MSAAAQAVGVFNERWATSSVTDRSISWPRPVSTGTGQPRHGAGDELVVERRQVGA